MEFDTFTVSLLVLRDDAPDWDDETASAMQDAHLDHLANLHEQGHLLAAGPLGHDKFRGLSILRVPPDEARALKEADPAVQAGRFEVVVVPWQVPAGAVHFTPTRFPHSIADVGGADSRHAQQRVLGGGPADLVPRRRREAERLLDRPRSRGRTAR